MVAYHPSHHSMVGQHPRLLLRLYPAPCPPPWARGVGLAQAGALQVGTMTRGREFKTITKAADQRLLFISTLPGKPTLGQGWSALPTGRRGSVMPHMATAAARAQHAHPHTFHPRASSVAGAWGWATASPAVTHSPQTTDRKSVPTTVGEARDAVPSPYRLPFYPPWRTSFNT